MQKIILILFIFLLAIPVSATTYYVSPSGDDDADGLSPAAAWQSIDNGDVKGILGPGDTVKIGSGIYNLSHTVTLTTSGTAGAPVVYVRYEDSAAVADGNNGTFSILQIDGDYVKVDGLHLANTQVPAVNVNGDSCTLTECSVRDIGNSGINIAGSGNLVLKCRILNIANSALLNGPTGHNTRFYGSTIYNAQVGINLGPIQTARIFNNIIDSIDTGIRGGSGNVCGFNNIWNYVSADYANGVTDSAGGISAEPLFIDPANGDFSLQPGSPCINAGLDQGYPFKGSAPDMGAVEYDPASGPRMGTAVWRSGNATVPRYNEWDGTSFGTPGNTENVGVWRIIQGAESRERDEIVLVGVDESGNISPMLWNGFSWSSLPFNPLSTVSQSSWWGMAVAYEGVSDNARIIFNNGSAGSEGLSHAAGKMFTWNLEGTIHTPVPGEPQHLRCAADPFSDEMVLVVSNSSSLDYALVWDGSVWGNSVVLDPGSGDDRTDIYVAYEQHSRRAMVVYGKGNTSVYYRLWDGSSWSSEDSLAKPADADGPVRWTTMGPDPGSDRIALGVVTGNQDVWLSVWDGSTWESPQTATNSAPGITFPAAAVAFDGQSGEAMAAYGEAASVRYRKWKNGLGWQAEATAANIGASPNSVMLDPAPQSAQIMLSVQDDNSDLNFVHWDGETWGKPDEQETNTGETKNQPFIFLWDMFDTPNQPPVLAAIGPKNTAENENLNFNVSATDAESTPTLSASTLPGGANFDDNGDGTGTFDWTPTYTQSGIYTITFYAADDSSAVDSERVTITVAEVNRPPVLSPIGPRSVEEGQNLNFGIAALDPDGTTPALSMENGPANADFVDNGDGSGTIDFNPDYTQEGVYDVIFIADDGDLADTEVVAITVTPAPIFYIDVVPASNVVVMLTSVPYSAFGYDAGSVLVSELTDSVTWSTTDPAGSVTAGGLYTAGDQISPPPYVVTARYQSSMSDSAEVTVISDGVLSSVRIEWPEGTEIGDTSLTTDNDTTELFCRGYDSGGNLLGELSVTWDVIGADAIGSVSPPTGTSTILDLSGTGTGRVTAVYSVDIADTTGTITCLPGSPAKVIVAPDTATISADSTLQFTATYYDADGNECDPMPIPVWEVIGGIGGIDLAGLFTPAAAGIGYIVASGTGVVDTTGPITVVPGALSYIDISPDSAAVSADSTLQFSALGYDGKGNECEPGNIAWDILDPIGTIDAAGLFDAVTVGQTRVAAVSSLGPVDTTAYLEVVAGQVAVLTVSPDSVSVTTDSSVAFKATGIDAEGNPTETGTLDWGVIGGIGDITPAGVFIPMTAGTGRVLAANPAVGVADTNKVVVVTPGILKHLVVLPDTATLQIGDTLACAAIGYDVWYNVTDAGDLEWSVSGGIGSIDSAGVFTATNSGIGQVVAVSSINGVSGTSGTIVVEILNVSSIPLGNTLVRPHQGACPILAFRVENFFASDKKLVGLRCRDASRGAGTSEERITNIDSLRLYLDVDADSLLTPSDSQVAVVGYAAATVLFTFPPLSVPPDSPRAFIVGADINLYPHDGDSMDVYFLPAFDLLCVDSTAVVGPITLNSLGYDVIDGLVAGQLSVTTTGTAVVTPWDSVYNVMTVDIPRNGYRPDTLTIIDIVNIGTAGVDDCDSLILYRDDGDNLWGGAGDEIRLGHLTFTGNRWTRSGLTVPLDDPMSRFYVGLTLSAYPQNGATVALAIPFGGLEMSSANDGPIDAATIPVDTILIETNEEVSITAVPVQFRELVPGRPTGPLLAAELTNAYAIDIVLDSLRCSLVAVDPDGATQEQLDSQIDSLLLYLNRDDDYAVISAADTVIGSAVLASGTAVFSAVDISVPANGGVLELVVAGGLSLTEAKNGNTIRIAVTAPGDFYFEQPVMIVGPFPIQNDTAFIINAFPAAAVAINVLEGASLFDGQTDCPVMDFVLPGNGYAADQLERIRIRNIGTLDEFTALLSVKLWHDTGNNGFSPDDKMLAKFVPTPPYWEVDDLDFPVSPAGTRFCITVDIAYKQTEAGTLQFRIPVEGVNYKSGTTGPDDLAVGNPNAHLVFPADRIFAVSIPAGSSGSVLPKSTKNVILSFALYNGYVPQGQTLDAITLSNVSRSQSDRAYADYELGQVSLFVDIDGSHTYNGDSLVATGMFAAGRLSLTGLNVNLESRTLMYFFVLVDVPRDLIDSDSLALSIATASDIVFKRPVDIGGDLPLTNGDYYLIVDGSVASQYAILYAPPRSVSPGDTDVVLMSFRPAINGDQYDTLESLSIVNLESADTSDFTGLEIWQDRNEDLLWQASDSFIGVFAYANQTWTADPLAVEVHGVPPMLFVLADVSDSAAPGATFRAGMPINGCWYSSANDGPHDRAVSAGNGITVSRSRLAVSVAPMEETYSVGQTVSVVITVTNLLNLEMTNVSGEILDGYDTTIAALAGGMWGPVTLPPRDSVNFTFDFLTLTPGSIVWEMCAVASDIPDTSAVVETPLIHIQSPPGEVFVRLINSIPTAVVKGQVNVFPLSIAYEHPDTSAVTASLRLDSLRLTIQDGAGTPRPAADVFSRMSLATGYTGLVVMDSIPGVPEVWLAFDEPVVVAPMEEQYYSLLVDIDSAATGSFAIALVDPGAIPIVDKNTLQPAPIDTGVGFPLMTASCRIDEPSQYMFVSSESVAESTANYGQQEVAVVQLNLRHPGAAGSSQIQFTGLFLQCLDAVSQPVAPAEIFEEVTINKQSIVIGHAVSAEFDPLGVGIDLSSPVTLSPEETASVTVHVSIRSVSAHSGFSVSVPDSTALVVRDLSSGSLLQASTDTLVLAAGVSAFPLASEWVDLKQPATSPELCLSSALPPSVIGGIDALDMLALVFAYPEDADHSSLYLSSAVVAVLDTLGRALGPDLLFDRIGVSFDGGPVVYQPYVTLENGLVLFLFGPDGITLQPGNGIDVTLVGDIKPEAPFDHFLLRLGDAGDIHMHDISDTLSHPGFIPPSGCTGSIPFETGVTRIFLPAGRPGLTVSETRLRTAFPGQTDVAMAECAVVYEGSTLRGDLALSRLTSRIVRRTGAGEVPAQAGQIFGTVRLSISDLPVSGTVTIDGDSLSIVFDTDYVISRGERADIALTCDILADAPLGNYPVRFEDSTFIGLADRQLATVIYPVLSGVAYPVYAAEISLAAPNLSASFRNYPNPFNPSRGEKTTIAYVLSADAYIDIEVFSITGKAVRTVAGNEFRAAGSHQRDIWTGINDIGRPVVPGTYFCRITARYSSGEVEEIKRKVAVVR